MNDIKNNINKIETNIEVPADNTDCVNQEHQRDEWGKFLNNKTFKIMKDNFNLLKSNILSLIDKITDSVNTQNTEIKKTNDSLKIVSDKVNDLSNGNLTLPNNVALLNKKNVFTDNVSVKSLSLDNNNIIKETVNNLEVGNATKNINIIGFGEKLLYNGKEIQTGSSQGGGDSSDCGGDSSDLSTLYSIPLLASTPFRAWNYSFNITPTNLSKAVKPTTDEEFNRYNSGELKLYADIKAPNIVGNSTITNNNQTKMLAYADNLYIPLPNYALETRLLNCMFTENVKNIPLDKIFGLSLRYQVDISRFTGNAGQVSFLHNTVITSEFKFNMNGLSDLTEARKRKDFISFFRNGQVNVQNGFERIFSHYPNPNSTASSIILYLKLFESGMKADINSLDGGDLENYEILQFYGYKTLTDGISDFTGLRVNISFENCNLLIKI